jgi:acyl dehydratase
VTASEAVTVGTVLPTRTFGPITMSDVVRYQGASGDLNPMHHDDELARAAGYPAAFSVGMLGAGYLATVCTDVFGVDAVRQFRTRFQSLVYRGDRLTATVRVSGLLAVDQERVVALELALTTQTGATAITGSALFALHETAQ